MEKRSRFIGRVWPVSGEEDALAHIAEMRRQHWDATHNVYAYIVRGGQTRYSDDGEPQGTSGMPTLNVFKAGGVFNVCCVVTRYYGGILLGAGGLVRAYSTAAKMALDAAGLSVMRLWSRMLLSCSYPLFEATKRLVADCGGVVEASDYGTDILLQVLVPLPDVEAFQVKVRDLSSGRMEAEAVETTRRAAPVS